MADHLGKKRNSSRDKRSKTGHLTSMMMSLEEAKVESPFDFDEKGKPHGTVPKFPNGIKLRLENISLKKLGMSPDDFHLGDLLTIEAHVEVVAVKNEHRLGEEPEMMVKLQITDLAVGEDGEDKSLADLVLKS